MAELQGEDSVHPLIGDQVTVSDVNARGRQQAGSLLVGNNNKFQDDNEDSSGPMGTSSHFLL